MKACVPRSLLLSLSWTLYTFVTQKALAILMSPKATYAAALDEMSPRPGSSAQLERSNVTSHPWQPGLPQAMESSLC